MRTKTLLFSAALVAAGVVSSMAQSTPVYSVNAVGYVNVDCGPGFTMIANQLNTSDNTISNLLRNLPDFTSFYKWNGTTFDIATTVGGEWDTPDLTLNPGEGGFINNGGSAFKITFVGEVPQGQSLSVSIPANYSIKSSIVPQAANADQLGLTAALHDFDSVLKWNTTSQGYDVFTVVGGEWDTGSAPSFGVGESFFVNAGQSTTWTRSFTVNQ